MYLNILTWSCPFSICTWISMENMFKKERSKIRPIRRCWYLLMVEKEIRGGICHAIHRYAKANSKHMKNCDKNKESSYIQHLGAKICMDG